MFSLSDANEAQNLLSHISQIHSPVFRGILIFFIFCILVAGVWYVGDKYKFFERLGLIELRERSKKLLTTKKYLFQYSFLNHGTNKEAKSFSRRFQEEIKKVGRKYKKDIHICNANGDEVHHNKMIYLEGIINEQLGDHNMDQQINEAEITIKYLSESNDIQCFITKSNAFDDIKKHTQGLIDFISKVFALLAAFNNDYNLAQRVASDLDGESRLLLYIYIDCKKLEDPRISYTEKMTISQGLLQRSDVPNRLDIDAIQMIYAKSLYKTGRFRDAEVFVDKMKSSFSANPAWYVNKAFFELLKNNEKKGFEEYERMRKKFTFEQINKAFVIDKTVEDLYLEIKDGKKKHLVLGIIYLLNWYMPDRFDYTIAKRYLKDAKTKSVKKRILKVIEEHERRLSELR